MRQHDAMAIAVLLVSACSISACHARTAGEHNPALSSHAPPVTEVAPKPADDAGTADEGLDLSGYTAVPGSDTFAIGNVTLTAKRAHANAPFVITLTVAGHTTQREEIVETSEGSHQEDGAVVPCFYPVDEVQAYVDPGHTRVAVVIHFHSHIDCDGIPDAYRVWPVVVR